MNAKNILAIFNAYVARTGKELQVNENQYQIWYKINFDNEQIVETMVRKATPDKVEFVTVGSKLSSTPRFFETVKSFKEYMTNQK